MSDMYLSFVITVFASMSPLTMTAQSAGMPSAATLRMTFSSMESTATSDDTITFLWAHTTSDPE
jgi:hypothetical protein